MSVIENSASFYATNCKILGVRQTATLDEIKAAYRRLARLYHPDLNPHCPEAESQLKTINAAYEALCARCSSVVDGKRHLQKASGQKQVSMDRDVMQSNSIYNLFVDSLLGNSNCSPRGR